MFYSYQTYVVICFQISIFEPLETTTSYELHQANVVICFQISIFEPLETTPNVLFISDILL